MFLESERDGITKQLVDAVYANTLLEFCLIIPLLDSTSCGSYWEHTTYRHQ